LLFLLALGLRVLYLQGALPLLETRQTPIYGDAARYYVSALARRLAEREPRALQRLLERGAAHWNIRLRVTERSGRVAIY
jgi:hypothetical protein